MLEQVELSLVTYKPSTASLHSDSYPWIIQIWINQLWMIVANHATSRAKPRGWRLACYHACMAQVTLRLPDRLAAELKSAAAAGGQSLNAWATAVLSAAVDPDLAGTEAERLRERLSRAGLLATPSHHRAHRPDPARVAAAREAAGQGRSLADLVAEGRG